MYLKKSLQSCIVLQSRVGLSGVLCALKISPMLTSLLINIASRFHSLPFQIQNPKSKIQGAPNFFSSVALHSSIVYGNDRNLPNPRFRPLCYCQP